MILVVYEVGQFVLYGKRRAKGYLNIVAKLEERDY